MKNLICFALDRLHRNFLGAYGNTWIRTPGLDRLAFHATVFDQHVLESPHPEKVLASIWTGRHPLESVSENTSLQEILRGNGIQPVLITDKPGILPRAFSEQFERYLLLTYPEPKQPAEEIAQTYLANIFAQCTAVLEEQPQPFCAWIVLRGLGGPWDAPLELREQYADEGDPSPYSAVEPPNIRFGKEDDPDILLAILQAYAAQVTVLDSCFEAFWEWLSGIGRARDTGVLFLSLRGFPLGEHAWIGRDGPTLYSEVLHTPLMIYLPERAPAAQQILSLVEPADLFPTILQLFGLGSEIPHRPVAASLVPLLEEEEETVHNRVLVTDQDGSRGMRTLHWYFRDADPPELYIKPDDFWDYNNVADRCSDVVEAMQQLLVHDLEALRNQCWDRLAELDPSISTRPE